MLESLFNIVAALKAYNFVKKKPQHRRFSEICVILLRTKNTYYKEHLRGFFWTQYKTGNR